MDLHPPVYKTACVSECVFMVEYLCPLALERTRNERDEGSEQKVSHQALTCSCRVSING